MQLKAPAGFTGRITDVDMKEYQPDANGVVTIPDDKMHNGLFGWGFTQVQPTAAVKQPSSN